jgi:hypothetical protein
MMNTRTAPFTKINISLYLRAFETRDAAPPPPRKRQSRRKNVGRRPAKRHR